MISFKRSSKDKHSKGPKITKAEPIQVDTSHSEVLDTPKKVIKSLYDYKAQGPGELTFKKGDFFHVIGSEDDPEWLEAYNPVTKAHGMVPVPYFETFFRTGHADLQPQDQAATNPNRQSLSILHAKVLYDFRKERDDELDIDAGDYIIVCAHYDYEWFIAKYINKLGGPGLVPASYVQLIDMKTGQPILRDMKSIVDQEKLPTIEEWKNNNARYRESSKIISSEYNQEGLHQNQQANHGDEYPPKLSRTGTDLSSQHWLAPTDPYVVSVNVESFYMTNDKFWFLVKATLSNGMVRLLCRFYEDFFNFQQNLLTRFPKEAGKQEGHQRIFPYIPGPLSYVNENITAKRRADLDDYFQHLFRLPDYITRSALVSALFEIRSGDKEFKSSDDLTLLNPRVSVLQYNNQSSSQQQRRSSQYQQDRLSQYEKHRQSDSINHLVKRMSSLNTETKSSSSSSSGLITSKLKLKFYFKDDIFVLIVPTTVGIADLKRLVASRLDHSASALHLYPKYGANIDENEYSEHDEIQSDDTLWGSKCFVDKGKVLVIAT
ncbi:hypothetical protein LJB42_004473 [Komagataella kurtzmanii]|nr:hypothetical protein LJB42_004473 [Komagataella kurtzmanii]